MKLSLRIVLSILVSMLLVGQGADLGTAFLYQGRLLDGGKTADGQYDLRFVLYDAATDGTAHAGPVAVLDVQVTNGLFTAEVDFGSDVFSGQASWLDVAVKPSGSTADHTVLDPRQSLSAAPYALFALRGNEGPQGPMGPQGPAGADGTDGATGPQGPVGPTGPIGLTGPDGPQGLPGIAGVSMEWLGSLANPPSAPALNQAYYNTTDGVSYIFDDADVWQILALDGAAGPEGAQGPEGPQGPIGLTGVQGPTGPQGLPGTDGADGAAGPQGPIGPQGPPGSADAWSRTGNAGTTAGVNSLGTTDNQPLEIKVNNVRVVRLEPSAEAPNFVAGFSGNAAAPSVAGATISGGGMIGADHVVTDNYGVIGGGQGNRAGDDAGTVSDANFGTVGGGHSNIAGGFSATVSGGAANEAAAGWAAVGGGGWNRVTDNHGTIGGGKGNQAGDADDFLDDADYATVGGGEDNIASGKGTTVSGGSENIAGKLWGTVAGGVWNKAVVGEGNTVGGGGWNTADGRFATIAGGDHNFASALWATVGGGGAANILFGNYATGEAATVPGGSANVASGDYSFAAGYRAKANHTGSLVWADSTDVDFASTQDNEFAILAAGGLRLHSDRGIALNAADSPLITRGWFAFTGGAYEGLGRFGLFMEPWTLTVGVPSHAAAGFQVVSYDEDSSINATLMSVNQSGIVTATGFNPTSDRDAKENFEDVDSREVLEKVASLPISRWNFKTESSVQHVGPVAQDFHAAFGLGMDDKHIATVDADGVALAAIQGLHEIVQEKDAEIQELKQTVADLRQMMLDLNRQVKGGRL